VSWEDCQVFLKKFNEKVGPGFGTFRLPTEAEWEYACRAGSTTKYCFGDEASKVGDYGWFRENSQGESHPVGQKKANAWGLYDMYGNVCEFCQDWNRGYVGDQAVFRGGSWYDDSRGWVLRGWATPGYRSRFLGCRLALVPSGN
jgi:formylglycine-generating enzyme required for sulfatase activity